MLYRFYDPVGRPRIIILIPVLSVDTILLSFQYFVPAFPDQSASPGNCSYSIEIETTCAPSAKTTDRISVRFSDMAGNLLLYAPRGMKNPGGVYGGFQRCAIDMFEASGACMSQIVCSLYLKKFGSDGWRPGWVKVLHRWDDGRLAPVSHTFYFRTFVPENVWYGFDYCRSRGGLTPHIASFHG
ncbi:hypothetical protein AAG906_008327 [Vitis piasezkii]